MTCQYIVAHRKKIVLYLKETYMEKNRVLQWHPGFRAVLRITLREEMKYLEMYEEYQLSRKPLQIDIRAFTSQIQTKSWKLIRVN